MSEEHRIVINCSAIPRETHRRSSPHAHRMDPTYPLLPIMHVLCVILVLLTLVTNLTHSWNTGICMYGIWVALENILNIVNAIVWSDNVDDVAPIWCDISTHCGIAANVGIAACSFVITRRLYFILTAGVRKRFASRHEKRVETLFELSLCLGLPILITAILFFFQANRYAIIEEFGCASQLVQSWLSMLVINSWSIIFPAISAFFYCPRIMWALYQRRKSSNESAGPNKPIHGVHFFRVLALGLLDVFLTLPVTVLGFYLEASQSHIVFWPGWTAAHADWERVLKFSSSDWQSSVWTNCIVRLDEWISVILAIPFFLLFGLTGEAIVSYKHAFRFILKCFGFNPPVARRDEISEVAFGSIVINSNTNAFMTHVSFDDGDWTASESSGPSSSVESGAKPTRRIEA